MLVAVRAVADGAQGRPDKAGDRGVRGHEAPVPYRDARCEPVSFERRSLLLTHAVLS